jgi:hypothetical protein
VLHFLRDGDAGDDVPACSRSHDDKVRHHARPPRMSDRFWFRHARRACFTSLRDMSLHRNRPPALRADAVLRTPFMRGLRA